MDITEDTIPELQPVFSFLNSHSNKLYQEGYFLKLDDQNTRTYSSYHDAWLPSTALVPSSPRHLTSPSARSLSSNLDHLHPHNVTQPTDTGAFRGQTQCRPNLDRMLLPARRNRSLPVGRCRA